MARNDPKDFTMKLWLTPLSITLTCSAALAQEFGQVISRSPLYQQVAVPRQVCQPVAVAVQPANSGAGALMGAIAGAAIGQQIGGGSGQALATMAGVIGGAMLGDRIESPATQLGQQQHCTVQNLMENRLVGYQVLYEYAGKQYSVQLAQDPGPTIALQVTPVGAVTASPSDAVTPNIIASQPLVLPPPAVVYSAPPVYYRPWPVTTHIQLGWGWPYRRGGHHGHRHWR